MDRRRFVPSAEGLEGRKLLSFLGGTTKSQANVPTTLPQKSLRIERMPGILNRIQPGRFLPKATITQLQADLRGIEGRLHRGPAPAPVLQAFTDELRDALKHPSLSAGEAQGLNRRFGQVLEAAGATPEATASLQADMNALVQSDTHDVNPAILATNDYAIVLQTALAVGRPILAPKAPALAAVDDTGAKGDHITAVTKPRLVGAYLSAVGSTMEIVDDSGNVLGHAVIGANGRYAVPFDSPLSVGTHVVRVRVTEGELHSAPSPPLTLTIVTKASSHAVPGGPLALK